MHPSPFYPNPMEAAPQAAKPRAQVEMTAHKFYTKYKDAIHPRNIFQVSSRRTAHFANPSDIPSGK